MKITILTLFPEMFNGFLENSIIKRAIAKDIVQIHLVNIRDYTLDKNKRVDDYPIGGGAGLIMKCQPIVDCIKANKTNLSKVIYMSPRGRSFNQNISKELSKEQEIILLCGHYEGIDERVLEYVDDSISIGDYILTGGEIPAMVISDSIIRLLDGAIAEDSLDTESFDNDLLEYPQYTFPRIYENKEVPEILLCGNHEAIRKYRLRESLRLTRIYRPDLFEKHKLTKEEIKLLHELDINEECPKWMKNAIKKGEKFLTK